MTVKKKPDPFVATHVALPVSAYKTLGQFLVSLPFSQVAPIIEFIQKNATAWQLAEDGTLHVDGFAREAPGEAGK